MEEEQGSEIQSQEPPKRNGIDFTSDHLFKKMVLFTIPLLLLSIAQMVFYSIDQLIVSNFGGGETSFAAVSSNNAIINLLIGSFLGISVGANIVLARDLGSKNPEGGQRTVQVSLLLSLIIGTLVAVIGIPLSRYFLILMSVPEAILGEATVYLQCCFGGMPFLMLFNFGAACFRAVGDGKRPLYILVIAGVVNIGLNLLFVLGFGMKENGADVLAVGLATLISQAIQALLMLILLLKSKNPYCRLSFKNCRLHKEETRLVLKNGLMAGFQFFIFSLSNVAIQRSVNSYSDANVSQLVAMNGNAAALQLEGHIAMALKAFGVAVLVMTAQNMGSQNGKNLKKILWMSLATTTTLSLVLSGIAVLCYRPLVGLFLPEKAFSNPEDYLAAVQVAHQRLLWVALFYFIDAWMDNIAAYSRGLGHPYAPSIVTFLSVTLYRLVFIFGIWANVGYFHTLPWLWSTWPISWLLAVLLYACFLPGWIKKALASFPKRDETKADIH